MAEGAPADRAGRGAAWRSWAALPLVALAGALDAIGWLRLNELFVSFMSGNSTLLGQALADGGAERAAVLALVVGMFLLGAIAGAAAARLAGRAWRAASVLTLVAVLLGLAAWVLPPLGAGGAPLPPWAWALVPAMGALNAALPGVGGLTFVTGSLARAAEALVAALAGAGTAAGFLAPLGAWAAMVAGAAGGAVLEGRVGGAGALAAPALAAAAAALLAGVLAARSRRHRRG